MPEYTENVIRSLKTKTNDSFSEPTYIGAEQRFVGGIRNSNLNNLEEQLIIGTDTYGWSQLDENNNKQTVKLFCPIDEETDIETADKYYKLITTEYENGMNQHYYFEDDTLKLSNYFEDSYFGNGSEGYPRLDTVYFLNKEEGEEVFYFPDNPANSFLIQPPLINTKTDELFFVKQGSEDIRVLTKQTAIINKSTHQNTIREKIVNHLKGEEG